MEANVEIRSRYTCICYVSEEEVGAHTGMKLFVKTDEFRKLNIAFALDEGMQRFAIRCPDR